MEKCASGPTRGSICGSWIDNFSRVRNGLRGGSVVEEFAEAQVINSSRVRNVLHHGSVAEAFAEEVLTSNQIRRNKHRNSSGFWQAMLDPFGGSHARIKAGQIWPSWDLLRYLEATALLLGARSGDFEGKLSYREVVLKVSSAVMTCWSYMSDFVRPCCRFCI